MIHCINRYLKRKLTKRPSFSVDHEEKILVVRALDTDPLSRFPPTKYNEEADIRNWNNSITTSLYTWYSFFPKNLSYQVIIPSNVYFIVIAVLQMIPVLSDSKGIPTFFIPLSFVIILAMIKDGYEDIKRHKHDFQENNRDTHILCEDGTIQTVKCASLKPGDIVFVRSEEEFPADLLVIKSSDQCGVSYVETSHLDGETNYKTKTTIPETAAFIDRGSFRDFKIEVEYHYPDEKLHLFNGSLKFRKVSTEMDLPREEDLSVPWTTNEAPSTDTKSEKIVTSTKYREMRYKECLDASASEVPSKSYTVNIDQFLWRRARLRNTDSVYGIVLYTGNFCKIFKSVKTRQLKYSHLFLQNNRNTLFLAGIQFFLCIVSGFWYCWQNFYDSKHWYLGLQDDEKKLMFMLQDFLIAFGRYAILLSYFVPITILVQLEIVRWFQACFLCSDKALSQGKNKQKPSVQTVGLIEELGDVTHIFTDKTGTLTRNLMQIRCLAIGPRMFGYLSDVSEASCNYRGLTVDQSNRVQKLRWSASRFVNIDSWSFLRQINQLPNMEKSQVKYALLAMSICHSVLQGKKNTDKESFPISDSPESLQFPNVQVVPTGNFQHFNAQRKNTHNLRIGMWNKYEEYPLDASSPDELALVCGAAHLGVAFIGRPNLRLIEIGLTNKISRDIILREEQKKLLLDLLEKLGYDSFGEKFYSYKDGYNFFREATENKFEREPIPCILYDILSVLDFDSTRKRMSVVIRECDTRRIIMFSKGADNSMISCCNEDVCPEEIERIDAQLEIFSNNGLRTLVFGYREINEETYNTFRVLLDKAQRANADQKILEAYEFLERDITLIGCTGIEDQLEFEVPETIQTLREGGIKISVLTGDKMETAISIGHRCNILNSNTYNAIVSGTSEDEVMNELRDCMAFILGAQLSKEEFEVLSLIQQARKNQSQHEKSSRTSSSIGTFANCCRTTISFSRHRFGESRRSIQPVKLQEKSLSMDWGNFVDIIRSKRRKERTKNDATELTNEVLTDAQIESIIGSYLRYFCKKGGEPERSECLEVETETATSPKNFKLQSELQRICPCFNSVDSNEEKNEIKISGVAPRSKTSFSKVDSSKSLTKRENSLRSQRDMVAKIILYPFENDLQTGEVNRLEKKASVENTYNAKKNCDGTLTNSENLTSNAITEIPNQLDLTANAPRQESVTAQTQEETERIATRKNSKTNSELYQEINLGPPLLLKYDILEKNVLNGEKSIRRNSPNHELDGNEVRQLTNLSLTLSGEALEVIFKKEHLKRLFFFLSNLSSTVIACRLTPQQKASLVIETSHYFKEAVTLAIGDGANDVSMIVSAHVGVGLRGNEGSQATRAADLIIDDFRFLPNILFYHGKESLRRNTLQMYHTVFRNTCLGFLFWFNGFLGGFAQDDLLHPILKQFYNLIFSTLSIMAYSIFDNLFWSDLLTRSPWLYSAASKPKSNNSYGTRIFLLWILFSVYCSLAIIIIFSNVLSDNSFKSNKTGLTLGMYGQSIYGALIIFANVLVLFFSNSHFTLIYLGIICGTAAWFLSWLCISMSTKSRMLYGTFSNLLGSVNFYFAMIIVLVISSLPLISYSSYSILIKPAATRIIKERLRNGNFDVVVGPKNSEGINVVVPRAATYKPDMGHELPDSKSRFQLYRKFEKKRGPFEVQRKLISKKPVNESNFKPESALGTKSSTI